MRQRIQKTVAAFWLPGAIFGALALLVLLTGQGVPCLFHAVTGLYGPGCGMTRGVNALLHLQFYQALRYNALLYPVGLFLFTQFLRLVYYWARGRRPGAKTTDRVAIGLIVLALLYGVARNLPMFSFLAPTIVL